MLSVCNWYVTHIIVNWLLGEDPPTFIKEAADYNKDGKITITDATALIEYLLNGSSSVNLHQFIDHEKMGIDWVQ